LNLSVVAGGGTDNNDAITQATNLGALTGIQSIDNWVGNADPNDFYRFTVGANTNVNILLGGLMSDADIELLDGSGSVIIGSYLGGTSAESITEQLASGTYFISVNQFYGDTSYNLTLSGFAASTDENDTRTDAQNLGALTGLINLDGWLGSTDTVDFYRFNLSASSNININLGGLVSDVDLQLQSASGSVLFTSSQGGASPENIVTSLLAGTYYLAVNRVWGNTGYNLQVGAAAVASDNNNTTLLAQNLGNLSGSQTLYGWVGTSDSVDFFRFTLGGQSNVNLLLNGMTSDADLYLHNAAGTVLFSSTMGGSSPESLTQTLNAGTYYVRVQQYNGNTNYGITFSAIGAGALTDANNSVTTAQNMGALNGILTANGFVGGDDLQDFFRFYVVDQSNVSVRMTGMSANADLTLLDGDGEEIGWSFWGGASDEEISQVLEQGTYFIQVDQSFGSTNYSLTVSGVSTANNTTAPTELGVINGSQTLYGWVDASNTVDFYRFSLSATTNLGLLLSGMVQDADLRLFNASGSSQIASSTLGGAAPENLNQLLGAGTYLIAVDQYYGATSYSLQISGASQTEVANNVLTQAQDVGVLAFVPQVVNGWVGTGDTVDIYRFSVTGTSFVNLGLTGLISDADLFLMNSAGGTLVSSVAGGPSAEFIGQQIGTGTYFVRVNRVVGDTAYNLTMSAAAASAILSDLAGNTTTAAENLGQLAPDMSINNWVGSSDTVDFFRFVLAAQSNVSAMISNMNADADLELLDFDGEVLVGSYQGGNASESVSDLLNAGTYFFRVFQYSGDTGYTLNINSAAVAADQAGNYTTAALNLGNLSGVLNFNGWVGQGNDIADYFRFTITSDTSVNVLLSGLVADADLNLWDSTGDWMSGSALGGNQSETVNLSLTAGTYYVSVEPFYGNTSYGLTISGIASNVLSDTNDTTQGATNLGTLVTSLNDFGWVGGGDSVDYYRFVVSTASNVNVALSDMMANADLLVFNNTGSILLGSSNAGGNTMDQVSLTLSAGTYLVRVNQSFGDTGYSLDILGSSTTDQAGNTLTLAQNLGSLSGSQEVYNWVGSTDSLDLYRFTLDSNGIVNLFLTGLLANADLYLLGSNGSVLETSNNSGVQSEDLTAELNAGTYYVRVMQNSGNTNYQLYLLGSAGAASDGNDSTEEADPLGVLGAPQSLNGWVGDGDEDDFYRFTLNSQSTVNLQLNGLMSDADLILRDSDGELISGSLQYGNSPETIVETLAQGTYYIQVSQVYGNTGYVLNTSAFSGATGGDSNNATSTAQNLGGLTGLQNLNGWVGGNDSNDYFAFSLSITSNVSLSLNGLTADADLYLLNASGSQIALSTAGGNTAENINQQLAAGSYYIRVAKYMGDTGYNLQVAAVGSAGDNNNTTLLAENLGGLSGNMNLFGWVGATDTFDFYRFTLSGSGFVNLLLSGMVADADLYLLGSNGSVLFSSTSGGSTQETISQSLLAGTYYARVQRYSGDTVYSLNISSSSATTTDSNNSITTAQSLGVLNGILEASGWTGVNGDPNDYFSFVLAENTNIHIDLAGMVANADLTLLDDGGNEIAWSSWGGNAAESIVGELEAGTYYLRVDQITGATNYDLTLSGFSSDVDNTNDTTLGAENLGNLAGSMTVYGWVDDEDVVDYFRFNLNALSNVTLLLSGLNADADLSLFNAAGSLIVGSYLGGSQSESITRELSAGTYYVAVDQYSGATNFSLQLSGVSTLDIAGNSTSQAMNVGTLGALPQQFNDWVGTSGTPDTVDFYRFVVGATSFLNLGLVGLASDANLFLLNAAGGTMVSSASGGNQNEFINQQVGAGTYYARVNQVAGSTAYQISLSANNAVGPEPGNTLSQAQNIGTLGTRQVFNNWVGASDAHDYYVFNLGTDTNLGLVLDGLFADADVRLLSGTGSVITISALGGTSPENISVFLSAGSYYVDVMQYSGDTGYSLTLTASGGGADPAGNTLSQAQNLGTLNQSTNINGWIGNSDPVDLYRFALAGEATINLNLTGLNSNADIYILDDQGTEWFSSTLNGTQNEQISAWLDTGTYYIKVNRFYGDTNYNLSVGYVPGDFDASDVGDTTSTAADLGTLSGLVELDGYVGAVNTADMYRFVLGGSSNFTAQLTDLVGDADLRIFGGNNGSVLIASSTLGGEQDDTVSLVLSAGTYYAKVNSFNGDTGYSLNLFQTGVADGAGNALSSAQSLGALSGLVNAVGWVGATDTVDFFRFTLSNQTNLSLFLTGMVGNADLSLLSASGSQLNWSSSSGSYDEYLDQVVDAGTYYVRISRVEGNTNYQLWLGGSSAEEIDNNSFETAEALPSLNQPVVLNNFVGDDDPYDFYSFIINSNLNVTINVNGLMADANLELFDSEGGLVNGSWMAGSDPEMVAESLVAGTYYILVSQYYGNTNYELRVSGFSNQADNNDTRTSPTNLGSLSGIQNIFGWVGSSDTADWYRFSIGAVSNVNLFLSQMQSDADIFLYAEGSTAALRSSAAGGSNNESIVINNLSAGTYYVYVDQWSGDTGYKLQLAALGTGDTGGNAASTAQDISSLMGTEINGWVGGTDTSDFYKFVLNGPSNVGMRLSNLTADANVKLLNGAGSVLAFPGFGGTEDENINMDLNGGTYYVQVTQGAGDSVYSLTVFSNSTGADNNDTFSQAADLGILNGSRSIDGFVGNNDPNDYYRFVLNAESNFSLTLENMVADADVTLYGSSNTIILASSSLGGSSSEYLEAELQAGTYTVYVRQYSGDTGYQLNLNAVSNNDGAGNTASEAFDVGALSGSLTFNDWVGDDDQNDFYKFSLNQASNVNISLSNLGADADVVLYDANGTRLAAPFLGGTSDENISLDLAGGTYYVRVAQFSGETSYQLQLSAGGGANENQDDTRANAVGVVEEGGDNDTLLEGFFTQNGFVGVD
ncbi:MAG: hypothetical protein G8345_15040, partial [Magnetococcales bacterium]|nr:hypothetical protein [Magnetococcales bacterium]